VIKTTRRGDYLTVVAKTRGWWKVYFQNGLTGWIERRDTAVLVPDDAPSPAEAADDREREPRGGVSVASVVS
jgi:hypothetical protein